MILTCDNCGSNFNRLGKGRKNSRYRVCSIECRAQMFHKRSRDIYPSSSQKNGYLTVLNENGVLEREHRLIMKDLLGRKLRSNEVVHHIDGNITNNDPNNLEVMTRADHISLHHKGEGHPNAILSDEDVVRMIELRHSGVLTKVIAKQFGISVHYCGEILQGIYRSDGWALYKEKHSGA